MPLQPSMRVYAQDRRETNSIELQKTAQNSISAQAPATKRLRKT